MGDVLLVMLPALILTAVLWAVATALKPRNFGISEAERYQQELAVKSQAHYAAQVRAAVAARARVEAATRPSQNSQQQSQQADHARSGQLARSASTSAGSQPGHGDALPGVGYLSPQLLLELQSLARSGHKLKAIQLLRQSTHADLKTSKNYVDRL
ncbi:hypothetical protein [Arthrobacter sp. NicSoilB8]|jgi:hypothetical protein|uniref:hypothetical protein n=1 Tax=Arthrobacter sp. NicSoilB8 TaxID=2830998 RepID=UPI001CC6A0D0|nr:hypothetical protein [Arthrobacter sp. NicSoilB8]BCW73377.1 hypothetical protein NicSoilB8_44210 [Arthrobacter sp. NicSoilB8]